jgi:hypothetical protein
MGPYVFIHILCNFKEELPPWEHVQGSKKTTWTWKSLELFFLISNYKFFWGDGG